LRGQLARAAYFLKEGKKKNKDGKEEEKYVCIPPPRDVVKDILSLPATPYPYIAGIVEAPVLRKSGTILDKPGFDYESKLYFHPRSDFKCPPIPHNPTRDEINRAVALLMEAICDFPFVDEASRTNALALMLTPIVRPTIDGCVPLGLIDAPQQGTGKGLLIEVISLIATGRTTATTTEAKWDDEWGKKITSLLMKGKTIISIDNIAGRLDSPKLASAIITKNWEDRILGVSESIEIAPRVTWIGNGNNVSLGGDMNRRCYYIRMDPKTSSPWERTGFRHAKLAEWVTENRPQLIAALLTIARGWFAAGKPPCGQTLGSFEDWVEVVGGVLKFAGLEGFIGNMDSLYSLADEDTSEWVEFLTALHKQFPQPFTTADVVTALEGVSGLDDTLPSDLAAEWAKRGKGFTRKLGKAFSSRKDRRFGSPQIWLEVAGEKQRATVWRVSM